MNKEEYEYIIKVLEIKSRSLKDTIKVTKDRLEYEFNNNLKKHIIKMIDEYETEYKLCISSLNNFKKEGVDNE